MKRILSAVLIISILFLCACSGDNTNKNSEPNTEVTANEPDNKFKSLSGTEYFFTKVEFTNAKFKAVTIPMELQELVNDSRVIISDDYTKMIYSNKSGEYYAYLDTTYDGEMWHESEVEWIDTPPMINGKTTTATSFIFDVNKGLIRMNFALDGDIGKKFSGEYTVFNEFETK